MEYHKLANLFPMMSKEELTSLCEDMRQGGYDNKFPVTLYEDKILDGRNRQLAADTVGVIPEYAQFSGSPQDAFFFVIRSNLNRRHLNESQRTIVAAKMANMPLGGAVYRSANLPTENNISQPEAAKMMRVSTRSVTSGKRILDKAPEMADKIMAGEMTVHEAEKEIKKAERVEGRTQEITAAPKSAIWNNEWKPGSVYIANVTIPEFIKSLPEESVDMVMTDPPWAEDAIETYEALGRMANRVLKPGGICAAYAGKMFLPEIMHILAQHLDYVWTFCVFQPDSNDKINKWHLFSAWRPIIVLKKPGAAPDMPWIPDALKCTRSKEHHPWGQGIEPSISLITAYTMKDELVLDPFTGGGTSLVAAKRLGRKFIGFEIDDNTASLAEKRITEEQ